MLLSDEIRGENGWTNGRETKQRESKRNDVPCDIILLQWFTEREGRGL